MRFLDMAVCFFFSAVTGTGVGGAGLFLIHLTGTMGLDQINAQAVNLFCFLAAAIPSTLTRCRTLPWRLAALCIAGGIPGVLLGSFLRSLLPEDLLGKIFGSLLIAAGTGAFLIRKKQ
ncbi:MAG: sulfite exporter TauE/SafE family protein [Clostridia bacterium]|nr:sulfite exporter TauE/SafE family protein [Clostridia bacterium]